MGECRDYLTCMFIAIYLPSRFLFTWTGSSSPASSYSEIYPGWTTTNYSESFPQHWRTFRCRKHGMPPMPKGIYIHLSAIPSYLNVCQCFLVLASSSLLQVMVDVTFLFRSLFKSDLRCFGEPPSPCFNRSTLSSFLGHKDKQTRKGNGLFFLLDPFGNG